ncbi:DNA polymerase III subunit delta [Alkalibacter mobilis]|uniref:DNA polymerase III subunit delta n=1 Tax=Alkalibacter mobilis TaxID=2787712 RepID=UPI0018A0BAB7|nr:DNA polymerase III subunit delta [Alkalibacter mobilis]MBF7096567.1 DNA polymerase III subunit delta [Alkalibacter mobilis]
MNYKELMAEIKNNEFHSIYLLYGEEYHISALMASNLKSAIIDPAFEQINFIKIDEKVQTADEIVGFCETLPFMSDRRMVLVSDSPLFFGGGSDKELDNLIEYIKSPNKSTSLVFLNRTVDSKRKLFKALQKNAALIESNKLNRSDLQKWISKRIRLSRKKIDVRDLDHLIQSTDYLNKDSKLKLEDIDNETEKLIAFVGDREIITREDIEKVISKSVEHNIFRMLDHIGTGNLKDGLEMLDYLLDSGEPPIRILQMVVRQLRMIYNAKILKNKGYSPDHIASEMKVRTFMINNALKQGRSFNHDKLNRAYGKCAQIDELLKSSKNDPKIMLELLLYDLR